MLLDLNDATNLNLFKNARLALIFLRLLKVHKYDKVLQSKSEKSSIYNLFELVMLEKGGENLKERKVISALSWSTFSSKSDF